MIGTELEGRYRIDAELGSGGVGTVYRATHLKLGRAVAIKVLRPEYGASAELVQRFQREAQALAALSHPNVVTVTDYGVVSDTPYLVMELLEGESLSERLRRGALDPADAMDVMRQLLTALAFVHDAGLVHRDVKPGNVFLQRVPGEKPHVRLLDFGLAKFLAPTGGGRPITRAGQIFGTPSYMAPEQVAGQDADARADVYAAGIIFFEMLAGRAPFKGKTSEVMRLHLMEELPKLETVNPERSATPELWALLQKATAKTRAERFTTVHEFVTALDALASPVVVPPGSAESLATQATSFSPNSAPTRVDAPPAAAPLREPPLATIRDEGVPSPNDKSPSPAPAGAGALEEPELPEPPLPPEVPLVAAPVRFVRAVVRFAISILVLTSLGALLAAAAVVYVLVTPEREKERRDLEQWLGRTAPAKSASPAKGAPPKSAPHASSVASAEAPPSAPKETARQTPESATPSASAALDEGELAARNDAVPAPSSDIPPVSDNAPPGDTHPAETAPPPRPLGPAPDPWATVPRDLVRLLGKVNKSQGLSKREISTVHHYNANHPDDARGHLVLARGYLNKRWIKDAANEYAIAMKVNEGARGDPRMLKDLVRIVEFGSSEAERLVREVYGPAAVATIDRALLDSPNPEAKERLEHLRSELKG